MKCSINCIINLPKTFVTMAKNDSLKNFLTDVYEIISVKLVLKTLAKVKMRFLEKASKFVQEDRKPDI